IILKRTPLLARMASSRSTKWRSMVARMATESCSQRRVLPSTSVNRKVTVPLGKSCIKTLGNRSSSTRLGDFAHDANTWHRSREPAGTVALLSGLGAGTRPLVQARSKETLMTTSGFGTTDRRMAIGGVLAVAAGLALPLRQSRTVFQRGMAGGGLARFDQGEANFSLFVSRLIFSDDTEVVVGSVIWVDEAAGLTLRST